MSADRRLSNHPLPLLQKEGRRLRNFIIVVADMKKGSQINQNFHVVYREVDGWFIATVPALPGCHTQGKTLNQAEQRITEAIEVYMESKAVMLSCDIQQRNVRPLSPSIAVKKFRNPFSWTSSSKQSLL